MRKIIRVDVWKLVSLAALQCGAVSCGGVGAESEEGTPGIAREAFGESTCGAATPDVTIAGPEDLVNSPDGNYDHPGPTGKCVHSYVLKVNSTNNAYRATAVYWGPNAPIEWGCNGAWTVMSLWKLSGGSYLKMGETPLVAGIPNTANTYCVDPAADIQIPSTGTYKIIGQAGFAINYTNVRVGVYAAETRNMSTQNDRGYTGDGDWAPNLLKGECASGRRVLGVSRIPTGNNSIRNLFCEEDPHQNPGNLTLDITSGNDRRSSTGGDWDVGFVKAQCPDGSAVTGVAQTTGGIVRRVRCGPQALGSVTDSCETKTFASGNMRDSLEGSEWSPGDYKGQCGGSGDVVGISKDGNGKPRSVLCCNVH